MSNPTDDLPAAVGAAANALTDGMVERLAATLGNAMELADRLNQPDTREAVEAWLDGLTVLHRTGGMATLFELVHALGAVKNAATDSMIERGAMLLEHLVSNMANEEVADLAHQTKEAMREARQDAGRSPSGGGLMATIALLSKPETQDALRFLVDVTTRMKAHR